MKEKKPTLWTRNFTLVTLATVLGAMGGIAGGFALSFLVFEETGSTLAAAIVVAIEIIPGFFVPLLASPLMDRLPRKPVLVWGDLINGLLYALLGTYLLLNDFTYVGYLCFSLLISTLGAFDRLAYSSIYPKLIPAGMEEKGYTVSGMVYPVLMVIMMPLAAVLYKTVGVGTILLMQAGLSVLAGLTENGIRIEEVKRLKEGERFSFTLWWKDLKEGAAYLKKEKGLLNIFSYMAVTNGVGQSYGTVLVAFFSTAPGFTMAMYSLFSVAEFLGRTVGGALHYCVKIPVKKRFSFAFFVYQAYEFMDMILLWLPYPLMLVNRALCGFLGINSATMRQSAVQRYIPEEFRARINAFDTVLCSLLYAALSLLVGLLGEYLDYRLCLTLCGAATSLVCWLTIFRGRRSVRAVYNKPEE